MGLHARPLINYVFGKKAKKEPVIDWGIKHGCYAYEAKDAYGYARKLKLYDLETCCGQDHAGYADRGSKSGSFY
jgi:hypothetical protein